MRLAPRRPSAAGQLQRCCDAAGQCFAGTNDSLCGSQGAPVPTVTTVSAKPTAAPPAIRSARASSAGKRTAAAVPARQAPVAARPTAPTNCVVNQTAAAARASLVVSAANHNARTRSAVTRTAAVARAGRARAAAHRAATTPSVANPTDATPPVWWARAAASRNASARRAEPPMAVTGSARWATTLRAARWSSKMRQRACTCPRPTHHDQQHQLGRLELRGASRAAAAGHPRGL